MVGKVADVLAGKNVNAIRLYMEVNVLPPHLPLLPLAMLHGVRTQLAVVHPKQPKLRAMYHVRVMVCNNLVRAMVLYAPAPVLFVFVAVPLLPAPLPAPTLPLIAPTNIRVMAVAGVVLAAQKIAAPPLITPPALYVI